MNMITAQSLQSCNLESVMLRYPYAGLKDQFGSFKPLPHSSKEWICEECGLHVPGKMWWNEQWMDNLKQELSLDIPRYTFCEPCIRDMLHSIWAEPGYEGMELEAVRVEHAYQHEIWHLDMLAYEPDRASLMDYCVQLPNRFQVRALMEVTGSEPGVDARLVQMWY